MTPVVLAAVVLLIATTVRAQVLKQVPADALVVVKFKNMRATSDKMGALANKFGITNMNPKAGDPLGAFKESLQAQNGFKDDGDAAIVVMAPAEGKKQPEIVALLPISDYKAFIANFPDATTEGAISSVKLPNENEPGFATQWGDYAAISNTKALLTKKPAGIAATGLAAKELDTKDIAIYANMKAIRDKALPRLQKSRDEVKQRVADQMKNKNAEAAQKYQGLTNTAIDEIMGLAEQFLQQAQGATLGLELSEDAIRPTGLVEFDPASQWGQTIAKIKNSDQPLLVGLPEMKYLFLMGMSIDQQSASKIIDDLLAPVQGEFAKLGDEGKAIQNYINAIKSMLQSTGSQATGFIAPSGAIGQDSLMQMVSVMNGKSDQILQAQREMFNSQQAVMQAFGTKSPVESSFTANAKTVDGVQLNQFTTKAAAPGDNPTAQEMQMQQVMGVMYGANGLVGYSGAVTPDKAIVTAGVSDEVLTKLIASAKAGDPNVTKAETVQQVAAQLPKKRVFEMYIPLDNIANTAVSYAKQFGMPINVQLPENLQPVGVTAGTEGSAIRFDGVIPAGTVQSLVSAGMQAAMNMQGGGAGPGAGAP